MEEGRQLSSCLSALEQEGGRRSMWIASHKPGSFPLCQSPPYPDTMGKQASREDLELEIFAADYYW